MKRLIVTLLLLFTSLNFSSAQMVWTDVSADENLPEGVRLFSGLDAGKRVFAYYLEADMNNPSIIVHPYIGQARPTTSFTSDVGAIAAINAGYFNVNTGGSVSAVVMPGQQVEAINILSVVRDEIAYPVTRAFYGVNEDRSSRIDWIYHFGNRFEDLYWYSAPTANVPGTPAPTPSREQGNLYENLLMGVGGGPVLVKNGEINYTYTEEGFFGNSGLVGDQRRARTAVGFTDDNKVIMLVVDFGRIVDGVIYTGMTLPEVADLMLSLGAVEAMNLDGGGSSTMSVDGRLINRPNGTTTQRSVPSILSIVPSDSLKIPPPPLGEVIIDTEEDGVTFTGGDWFQTANFGDSYGGAASASWLVPPGDGSQFASYLPDLQNARYEVYGWWSASSNRTNNTPYTITHADGSTTVRVDQKVNNAQWVSLGEYQFTGTASDQVVVSNDAGGGDYVVADAIRFRQTTPAVVSTPLKSALPESLRLHQNFPNPFNPVTSISFDLAAAGNVTIEIYDMTGRLLETVYSGVLPAGNHAVQFDASGYASGSYVYSLRTQDVRLTRRMTLIK